MVLLGGHHTVVGVGRVYIHPGYNTGVVGDMDLALLRLVHRVDITKYTPVCLPEVYKNNNNNNNNNTVRDLAWLVGKLELGCKHWLTKYMLNKKDFGLENFFLQNNLGSEHF